MDQIVIQREGLPKNPPYSMPDTKVDEAKINEQWLLDLLCDQGKDQDLEMDFKKSLFAWNDTLLTGERLQVWIHKENKPFFDKRSQMSKMRRMLQELVSREVPHENPLQGEERVSGSLEETHGVN
ncbi:hypothetical protein B9Z55_028659 [Caenorhabditis nigoni]|uniref:Uncharacterized protein n=1 Tax=Caenorhabditis nigoni TaxID=1611254 RepID=A0A2G5SB32_9PELO|nr:hypothetical protein B9Z55_028659 [Caenorhabditis nigoni]